MIRVLSVSGLGSEKTRFQTRKLHFEHKTTAGLPQDLRGNLHRVSSPLISLRSICRACKSTSQRKLESWHAGTIPEVVRFIYPAPSGLIACQ